MTLIVRDRTGICDKCMLWCIVTVKWEDNGLAIIFIEFLCTDTELINTHNEFNPLTTGNYIYTFSKICST